MEKRDKGAGGTDAGSPKGGQSGLVPGERSQRSGPRGSWEARGRDLPGPPPTPEPPPREPWPCRAPPAPHLSSPAGSECPPEGPAPHAFSCAPPSCRTGSRGGRWEL